MICVGPDVELRLVDLAWFADPADDDQIRCRLVTDDDQHRLADTHRGRVLARPEGAVFGGQDVHAGRRLQ